MIVEIYLINGRMLHSSTFHAFDRKYKQIKLHGKYLSVDLILHILWMILRKMSKCLFAAVANWFATSAKLTLSRVLMWTYTNITACSRLFPHVISQSWPEEFF